MRRLPSQIPETVSRLIKSTYIQTPPIWYQAVLANPPPILPARRSHPRPDLDHSFGDPKPRTSFKRSKPREIRYEEDRVRRQFFRDFPFEALRPTSLVEGLEVQAKYEVDGPGWISLEQRGAYPSVENCIAFTLNLRTHQQMPITQAYAKATAEFVHLRARHEMATMAAEMEARHHGATFGPDPFERSFRLESKALDTLRPASGVGSRNEAVRVKYKKPKRWSSVVLPTAVSSTEFAGGHNYVKRWRLPPPLEIETEKAEEPANTIPPPVNVEDEDTKAEEEVDDLQFFREALRVPSREG